MSKVINLLLEKVSETFVLYGKGIALSYGLSEPMTPENGDGKCGSIISDEDSLPDAGCGSVTTPFLESAPSSKSSPKQPN